MAAHKLSKKQQIKGLKKAIKSWRTPPWLKPSIRGYLKRMEIELRKEGRLRPTRKRSNLNSRSNSGKDRQLK